MKCYGRYGVTEAFWSGAGFDLTASSYAPQSFIAMGYLPGTVLFETAGNSNRSQRRLLRLIYAYCASTRRYRRTAEHANPATDTLMMSGTGTAREANRN